MIDINNIRKIVDVIIDGKLGTNDGLMGGNMGICIFLYCFARESRDSKVESYADFLLDRIFERQTTMTPENFERGLAGIGWGIEYLVYHGFCEGDMNEVLEEIDDRIFKIICENERLGLDIANGLIGYLLYIVSRLENSVLRDDVNTQINLGLLRKIIHRIDKITIDQFKDMVKDISFDLLWKYPVLLWGLRKTLDLNVYNDKIILMIKQWMFYLEGYMPGIHTHRLAWAIALQNVNKYVKSIKIEKQVRILMYSLDYSQLNAEIDPYAWNIRYGWPGVVWLLKKAEENLDESFPNYVLLKQWRSEIVNRFSKELEQQISNLLELEKNEKGLALGISEGWAGIGWFSLLYPEIFLS